MDDGIENAVIRSTHLGPEDHGIFTVYIGLDGGGWFQSFGGYGGFTQKGADGKHHGHAYGMDFILEVMRVVGVERWEDLKGKHVRVRRERGLLVALGHIVKDEWFEPDALAKKHYPGKAE